jgi:hypothetical protein
VIATLIVRSVDASLAFAVFAASFLGFGSAGLVVG